jgi:hypothetical protein
VLKISGMIADQQFSILIDPSVALKRIKVKVVDLGEFVTSVNLFVTILGSYGIMIGMDLLESHDTILKCKKKILILIYDLGQSRVIVGRNQGVSLRFIYSPQLQKNMHKGCKLYAILALNEKGYMEILEYIPVVSEFVDVFPEEISSLPRNRELEFTIDLKPET